MVKILMISFDIKVKTGLGGGGMDNLCQSPRRPNFGAACRGDFIIPSLIRVIYLYIGALSKERINGRN